MSRRTVGGLQRLLFTVDSAYYNNFTSLPGVQSRQVAGQSEAFRGESYTLRLVPHPDTELGESYTATLSLVSFPTGITSEFTNYLPFVTH